MDDKRLTAEDLGFESGEELVTAEGLAAAVEGLTASNIEARMKSEAEVLRKIAAAASGDRPPLVKRDDLKGLDEDELASALVMANSKRLVGLVGDFKTVVEAKATYRLPVIQELSDQERLKFFDKVCDRLAVELDNQLRRDFEELGIEVMPAKAKRSFWGK